MSVGSTSQLNETHRQQKGYVFTNMADFANFVLLNKEVIVLIVFVTLVKKEKEPILNDVSIMI